MSCDFSVASPTEVFELGSGPWGWNYKGGNGAQYEPSFQKITELPRDKEEFAAHTLNVWNHGHVEPGNEEYILDVGRRLFDFCEKHSWNVKLVSDHDGDCDDWDELPVVDSRYGKESITNASDEEE
jgi:hypothetical protein